MKIAFIGSRGIPANYGGFETFVEEVVGGLSQNHGFQIRVVGDIHQKKQLNSVSEYKGVDILYSKYSKPNQTIRFYLDSMIKVWDADVIYSCGVGNAFFLFIPYLFRKKFVTNPDGIGWKRLKWSNSGRKILKFMFYLSAKLSPNIVADSVGVEEVFKKEFNRTKKIATIEYGAFLNTTCGLKNTEVTNVLEKYSLQSNKYHLIVSRLEPENNVDMIIDGYLKSEACLRLVIVGNLMETDYVRTLTKHNDENIVFLGGIYNKFELEVVRSNALSYFHGHSVGGTNPSLLEAMASKNICACHDNGFNRGVVGEFGFYFTTKNDVPDIFYNIEQNDFPEYREGVYQKVKDYFNWGNIVKLYANYFKTINN